MLTMLTPGYGRWRNLDRPPSHSQMGSRRIRRRPLAVGSLRSGLQRRYPIWGWPGALGFANGVFGVMLGLREKVIKRFEFVLRWSHSGRILVAKWDAGKIV